MSTTHYVFFDGCSHFVGSLEYDSTEDTEVVFKSTDFQKCCDMADDLNDQCTD
jgi:hypothetical protein